MLGELFGPNKYGERANCCPAHLSSVASSSVVTVQQPGAFACAQVLNFVVYLLIGRYFRQNLIERLGLSNLLSGRLFQGARSLSSGRRNQQQPAMQNGRHEEAGQRSPQPSHRASGLPALRFADNGYETPARSTGGGRGRVGVVVESTPTPGLTPGSRDSSLLLWAVHRFL